MANVSALHCKTSVAWWFKWLFVPTFQTVCRINDLLGIEYDEGEFLRYVVGKAVKCKIVSGDYD